MVVSDESTSSTTNQGPKVQVVPRMLFYKIVYGRRSYKSEQCATAAYHSVRKGKECLRAGRASHPSCAPGTNIEIIVTPSRLDEDSWIFYVNMLPGMSFCFHFARNLNTLKKRIAKQNKNETKRNPGTTVK